MGGHKVGGCNHGRAQGWEGARARGYKVEVTRLGGHKSRRAQEQECAQTGGHMQG